MKKLFVLCVAAFIMSAAFSQTKRIDQLPAVTTMHDTDLFFLGNPTFGMLHKITALNAKSYFGGGGSGTVTNVTGTAPISVLNGTTAPVISIANAAADGLTKGAASFALNDFNSSSGNISIDYVNGQPANTTTKGFLTSTDWNTFNNKQDAITLTTLGTSGAATFVSNVLNIPQYSGGGGGGFYQTIQRAGVAVTQRATFNFLAPLNAVDNGGTRTNISIPAADGTTDGYLSSTDWLNFNAGKRFGYPGGGDVTTDQNRDFDLANFTLNIHDGGGITLSTQGFGGLLFQGYNATFTGANSTLITGGGLTLKGNFGIAQFSNMHNTGVANDMMQLSVENVTGGVIKKALFPNSDGTFVFSVNGNLPDATTGDVTISAGGSGIDDVLAAAQPLSAPRSIDIAENALSINSGTLYPSGLLGFAFHASRAKVYIGDYALAHNGTYIEVNDEFSRINLNATSVNSYGVLNMNTFGITGLATPTLSGDAATKDYVDMKRTLHTIFTPLTGDGIELLSNQYNIVNPAGTIAALDIILSGGVADGDFVEIKFTQNVTTITYAGSGATVQSPVTSAIAGTYIKLVYDLATNTWY